MSRFGRFAAVDPDIKPPPRSTTRRLLVGLGLGIGALLGMRWLFVNPAHPPLPASTPPRDPAHSQE